MIKTVSNKTNVQHIKYCPNYSTVCSIGQASFWGEMEIVYKPSSKLLEFESFEKWLKTLTLKQLTIEDLCRLVFDTLSEVFGDIPLSVTIHAKTTVHAPVSATIKQGDFK